MDTLKNGGKKQKKEKKALQNEDDKDATMLEKMKARHKKELQDKEKYHKKEMVKVRKDAMLLLMKTELAREVEWHMENNIRAQLAG